MGTRRIGIVGGGIVGVALAHRIVGMGLDVDVTVLEKEPALARHQTGRNSGVVHAGLYYVPGSLKARLCRRGVGLLREFCAAHGLAYEECGKVVVALDGGELARLEAIHERAQANGVPGVRMVGREELAELEPHVRGVAALHSPHTAIVDFGEVTRRLAADAPPPGPPSAPASRSGASPRTAAAWPWRPAASGSPSTSWSSAAGCTPTGWPAWPATTATRGWCRSGASTTSSPRTAAAWSTASSTRCRTRATRSSGST